MTNEIRTDYDSFGSHVVVDGGRQAQGMLSEAKRCYLEAIRIKPSFSIAWSNLAGIFKEEVRLGREGDTDD